MVNADVTAFGSFCEGCGGQRLQRLDYKGQVIEIDDEDEDDIEEIDNEEVDA